MQFVIVFVRAAHKLLLTNDVELHAMQVVGDWVVEYVTQVAMGMMAEHALLARKYPTAQEVHVVKALYVAQFGMIGGGFCTHNPLER